MGPTKYKSLSNQCLAQMDLEANKFQKQPMGDSSSSFILKIGELIDPD